MDTHNLYLRLVLAGLPDALSSTCAKFVGTGDNPSSPFDLEGCANELFDVAPAGDYGAGTKSEALAGLIRHCFAAERFSSQYHQAHHEAALTAAGFSPACRCAILVAIDPFIHTARDGLVRKSIQYPLDAGSVVMCDFRFLRKPEMQKIRRVIVVSPRSKNGRRLTVVPVSMSEPPNPSAHHRFGPGSYPFFHQQNPVWAICDHPSTVALNRLWFVNVSRKPDTNARIASSDLDSLRAQIRTTLGLGP